MKKEQHMKINTEAKRLAAMVFAEKEVADQRAKLEELCNKYEAELAELTERERAAKDGNTDLSEKFEDLKTQKKELEGKLTVSESEKAELMKKIEDSEKAINDLKAVVSKMENEAKLQSRIKSLEEAGILSKGKAAERQLKRVKSMDDEAFAEWLDEQKTLKEEWIEQAKASNKPKDPVKEPAKDPVKDPDPKDSASENNDDDDEEDFDETVKNMSRADLIKAMRASAGLNLTSKKKATSDDLDPEYTKKLNSMWDEDEKKGKA